MAQSAHREAVGYFEQALDALPHLPGTRDTQEQAIDLRLALRSALLLSGNSRRILAALREAESLAVALDDSRRLGQVSGLLSVQFSLMGAHDQAIIAAQRALALATAGGEVVLQALANRFLGAAYQAQGDYRRAIDCYRQTLEALDGARHHERFSLPIPPAVLSRVRLTWCYAELGMFAEGRVLGDEGLRIAEASAHPASLISASCGSRSAGPPPRRPAQGTPPARAGHGHLSGCGPPILFPHNSYTLGSGVHPGRARCRRHTAAHAGNGTDHCKW